MISAMGNANLEEAHPPEVVQFGIFLCWGFGD